MVEVFTFELNETFSYADITIPYDAAKTTFPANLSLAYYNATTSNYTFVPTTLDTVHHTVTARLPDPRVFFHGANIVALDRDKYRARPAQAQTVSGYIEIGPIDNWTIEETDIAHGHTTWYYGGLPYPPGNYTIVPSGYYHHIEMMGYCGFEKNAWENYGGTGPYVSYTGTAGPTMAMVSTLVNQSDPAHRLRFNHTGGPVGITIVPVAPTACGDLYYQMYYEDGPAMPGDLDYKKELNNTLFNLLDLNNQIVMVNNRATAGCVLGQAGKKGAALDTIHSWIPGWSTLMNDEIAESTPYMVGHVACSFLFPYPEIRDFIAFGAQGDLLGAALNLVGVGSLGKTRFLLETGDFIPALIAKNSREIDPGFRIMNDLWAQGIYHLGLPVAGKIAMLDKAFGGAATRLEGLGISDEVIAGVFERGGNVGRTLKAGVSSDGRIVWLEEGTSTWGWQHILQHKSQIIQKFGSKTDQEIQNMIADTIASPDQIIQDPSNEYKYIKKFIAIDGNPYDFSVIVSDRLNGIGIGNIVTAHPGV
jgi:hypothetical protein